MSGQIFISYRREESWGVAGRLFDRLCTNFGPEQVFMDIDAIALGEDFVTAIENTVAKCDVLIAVIGSDWLDSKDRRGVRRLDNPDDFVRMEIGVALKRGIRVIPVLAGGALMPWSTDLPEDLKPLVRRNALSIRDTSFEGDFQRLVTTIRLVLEKTGVERRAREEKERLEAEQREKDKSEAEEVEREEKLEQVPQSQLQAEYMQMWLQHAPKPPERGYNSYDVFISYRSPDRSWAMACTMP
jgi:TIR domain